MRLSKYEHACFVVEKDGVSVVIDPGNLTNDFIMPDAVAAIIITHEHGDHFDPDQIADILEDHPRAIVIGPADVVKQLPGRETRAVKGGDNFTIEGIELEFYGDTHATIQKGLPTLQNVGVMIDERVYYPGDSFTVPEKSVDTLALPISAPWMKISESLDFLAAVTPRTAFPTHDAILSRSGQMIVDRLVEQFAHQADIEYERVDGQTIEIE